jgi:hypothetical protein
MKPSLFDLWSIYHFDCLMIALAADVDVSIVHSMCGNEPVHREDAQKVLATLSTIFQKEYTLDMVYVALIEPVVADESRSEVARILAEIDAEYNAGKQGLYGFAEGTSRHTFITRKTERMWERVQELSTTVGEEAAMELMIAWQDKEASKTQNI